MAAEDLTSDEIIKHIGQGGINEFLYIVDEAAKIQDTKLKNFTRNQVAKDHQRHLESAGYEPVCPKCHAKGQKNGKRNETQRYRCPKCGTRFTAFSGTLLEKSNYTWSVWLEVIRGMLTGASLDTTLRTLTDDYHCMTIQKNTVWLMRMKVMAAIKELPSPTLSGVIQIDDTFFRENQKASLTLTNPLPGDILPEREARYGRVPSQLGIRSPEFASIATMIDQSKHCVIRLLSMGVPDVELVYDFIADNTKGISYACSDADDNYRTVFSNMGIPHYIHPSLYWDTIKAAGYEQPSRKDKEKAKQQRAANEAILERLWGEGAIDRIENRGSMTYRQFKEQKKNNRLNLGAVNALHDEMKESIQKRTRGVSTKLLPYYLAWFEYTHNKRVDEGHKLASLKDAEKILLDAISAHRNLSIGELEETRDSPLPLPKPSGRYLHSLMRYTDKVRKDTGNDDFYFTAEDGVETFDRKKIMGKMSDEQLRALARGVHIRSWREKARTTLIRELMGKDELDDIFFLVATGNADIRTPEVYGKGKEAGRYASHRDAKGLFTVKGTATPKRAKGPIVFLDCETTGVNFKRDEILSLAIVDENGEVLYDGMFKPENRKSWSKAEKVNHISPKDVADAPTITQEKEKIERILADAGCMVGWNVPFDLKMLYACGVDVPTEPKRRCDLMRAYDKWRSRNDAGYEASGKAKLTEATEHFGLFHNAHNALGDTIVLLDIWGRVIG